MYWLLLSLASGFPVAVKNVIARKIVLSDQQIEAYMGVKFSQKATKKFYRQGAKQNVFN